MQKRPSPKTLKRFAVCASFRREYDEKMHIEFPFLFKLFYGKIFTCVTYYLKRKENQMSASDDYHRHRSRTATKYFKVSVKPFQRLAECEAEPHEKAALAGRGAAAPERSLKKIYLNKGNV